MKKESMLRSQMQTEFELKLKKHIQAHEETLQKIKLAVELQLQKNLKVYARNPNLLMGG